MTFPFPVPLVSAWASSPPLPTLTGALISKLFSDFSTSLFLPSAAISPFTDRTARSPLPFPTALMLTLLLSSVLPRVVLEMAPGIVPITGLTDVIVHSPVAPDSESVDMLALSPMETTAPDVSIVPPAPVCAEASSLPVTDTRPDAMSADRTMAPACPFKVLASIMPLLLTAALASWLAPDKPCAASVTWPPFARIVVKFSTRAAAEPASIR